MLETIVGAWIVTVESIAFTWVSLCIVWCFRMYLVHKFRMRRLNEINFFMGKSLVFENIKDLDALTKNLDFVIEVFEDVRRFDHLECHVLDLTKWRYRQFFPIALTERK